MSQFHEEEYREVDVQRDENGMIIMPSERRTEPPPKTGGMAGIIFVAVAAVAGIGGYFMMENAPPAQDYAIEQTDTTAPYETAQPQQLALNETAVPAATPTPAPVQRQAAPRAAPEPRAEAPMPTPVPEAVPPIAPSDPLAPPPAMDLSTPPTGE
jgi:hypothetical protein